MAKRSYIQSIKSKQTSAYRDQPRTGQAIERISKLKSFPGANPPSEAAKDAQAEKSMNPHGYSRKRNPICPTCFVQMPTVGGCPSCER
jgi:hypothetical protein